MAGGQGPAREAGARRTPGSNLLRDAIARTVEAAETIGVRALLVHALHERARDFYLHYDFEPSPTDPMHLMLLMKDARMVIRRQR